MTVIRPNSISGITSITSTGADITYFKSDGTRGNQFTHNVSSTGIITATKFSGPATGLTDSPNITVSTLNAGAGNFSSNVTISGNLGVAGTITSEDKTNIDSVGLITARTGIKIGPSAGVAGTFFADGSYVTAGVITATTYYGSGAQLTGITGTTINSNANDRVITGSASANTLNGESNLLFDGSHFQVKATGTTANLSITGGEGGGAYLNLNADEADDNNDKVRFGINDGCGVYFQNYADGGWETTWHSTGGGNIDLYHNNGKKFETTAAGAKVTGDLEVTGTPPVASIGVAGNYPGNHVIFGTNAGLYGSANYKICIGPDAGRYGSARHNNVFIGVGAGKGASSGTVNGQSNVCVGQYTAQDLTTGSSNTCLGPNAGENLTTGNHNVIIGSCGRSVQNSENSTIIGKSAGYSITQSSQSVILGHGASGETLQGDAADNQLFIARQGYGGGSSGTWIYGNSSGQCQQGGGSSSWYTGSDERYKDFLGKYPRGLAEINGLQVQNFKWKNEENMPSIAFNYAGSYCGPEIDGKTRIGVGAQSCEALIPEAVNKLEPAELEKGGNHMLTLDNDPIFWAMVNAIQELSAKNDALTARVTALES